MNNYITLTDDELCAIMTSLKMTIMAQQAYAAKGLSLDAESAEALSEVKALYDRLDSEYF